MAGGIPGLGESILSPGGSRRAWIYRHHLSPPTGDSSETVCWVNLLNLDSLVGLNTHFHANFFFEGVAAEVLGETDGDHLFIVPRWFLPYGQGRESCAIIRGKRARNRLANPPRRVG